MIYKHHKPSGFFGTELAALMTYENIDTAVVTGMTQGSGSIFCVSGITRS